MKKNFFFSMLAVAGLLFATSCQQEMQPVDAPQSDYFDASFSISATEGMGTKAIGNGLTVDKVACAVFDANGAEMTALRQYVNCNAGVAQYQVRLAKGQAYRVAFFAYNEAAQAYDVTDMKNIVVNENQFSNIEARDAFTNYIDITADETMNTISKPVILYRPFAQLNMGIDNTELEDAAKAGVVVTNTKVVVNNVYKAFSAFDNAVPTTAQLETMTFALNGIPQEKLTVNGKEYNYLAMNYILVGDKGVEKGLTDIEFVWATADGKTNNPTTHFVNVPAQRNFRTNIIGKLLTNPADFNITIDAAFDGDKNENVVTVVTTEVANADELQAAINVAAAGQNIIRMTADIKADEIVVEQKTDVEIFIDGQGFELDAHVVVDGNNGYLGTEGLTLENIKFNYSGTAGEIVNAPLSDAAGNNNQYAHNIIIKNCQFYATTNAANITALRTRQAFDVKVIQSYAEGLHSFAQLTGGHTVEFDQIESKCTRGIALGSATNCKIVGAEIVTAAGKYGIRHDANSGSDVLKVANCTIKAFIPVVVRRTNTTPVTGYSLVFEGTNNFTKAGEYHVAIAQEEYDAEGDTLTSFGPVVTVTGEDTSWVIFK